MNLPGTKKIKCSEFVPQNIEVGIYQNAVGAFAVVMREGKEVKGLLCLSEEQANDLFETCIDKVKTKFNVLN